uniref:Uncharacterized protein n=1 Tax=Pyricularia oryzae (strain P131) TaxID=1143193 RepID=L7JSK2_PYRO1
MEGFKDLGPPRIKATARSDEAPSCPRGGFCGEPSRRASSSRRATTARTSKASPDLPLG